VGPVEGSDTKEVTQELQLVALVATHEACLCRGRNPYPAGAASGGHGGAQHKGQKNLQLEHDEQLELESLFKLISPGVQGHCEVLASGLAA